MQLSGCAFDGFSSPNNPFNMFLKIIKKITIKKKYVNGISKEQFVLFIMSDRQHGRHPVYLMPDTKQSNNHYCQFISL